MLLAEMLYESISVYDISRKTSMSPKPLRIRFDKIDGMIIVLDAKVKHLILLVMDLIKKKRVLQILLIIILE